jgi:hypothetical protein
MPRPQDTGTPHREIMFLISSFLSVQRGFAVVGKFKNSIIEFLALSGSGRYAWPSVQ